MIGKRLARKSLYNKRTTRQQTLPYVVGFSFCKGLIFVNIVMYIRRKIMNECKGNPRLQKAVAIVLYMKQTLSRDGMIKDFSYNKIYELTGIAPTTIRKYLPIMEQHGFVCFQGKNLVLKSLHSKHQDRNICVDKFNFNSFKDTFKSLRSFLALIVQAHKDFLKRTLQIVANPKNNKEFQAARKLVGRLVKQGILHDRHQKYKEFGLGYKRIAKEIGSCVKTAQNIMHYAINKVMIYLLAEKVSYGVDF